MEIWAACLPLNCVEMMEILVLKLVDQQGKARINFPKKHCEVF